MEKEGASSIGCWEVLFMAVEGSGKARHWIFDGGESTAVGDSVDRLKPLGDSGEATDGDRSITGQALLGRSREPEVSKIRLEIPEM